MVFAVQDLVDALIRELKRFRQGWNRFPCCVALSDEFVAIRLFSLHVILWGRSLPIHEGQKVLDRLVEGIKTRIPQTF